jgi:FlaA1/EpsC-like NDP-sugar epimerase
LLAEGPYDYVLNLSALKHVRSEKDPFTLMRMVDVNVFNTVKTLRMARDGGAKKYFCVSTDKAANPVNMMGASKRIMEMFLMRESLTSRFRWPGLPMWRFLMGRCCMASTSVLPNANRFRRPMTCGAIL